MAARAGHRRTRSARHGRPRCRLGRACRLLLAPSLFATRRLVEVRLPTGKPGTEGGKADRRILRGAATGRGPGDHGEWSRQHPGKWTEAIARVGHTCIAWEVRPHELESWIERRLRQRGLRATPTWVARLAQRIEGNLLAAAQEIDKLVLLAEGDAPIDLARMDALVADPTATTCSAWIRRGPQRAAGAGLAHVCWVACGRRGGAALMGMVVKELQTVAAGTCAQFRRRMQGVARIWDSKQAV